jgi:23S rRNA (adenine2030-N6)-methyltransferase
MNYRHAYHAGNFADCMKHALLVMLLRAQMRKPAGLFILDSHAGAGRYDLAAAAAARTGEARDGILRLLAAPPLPALADYLGLVGQLGLYPGSPLIIQAVLRAEDRLSCCELHPEEYAALRRALGRDPRVAVHARDAWEALPALLPPARQMPRRGLVLIDPPFEQPDEFSRLAAKLRQAVTRFPGGVFAAWYPIKHRAPVRDFQDQIRALGLRDVIALELYLRPPLDAARLNGCGLLIIRPPYGSEAAAVPILHALEQGLGTRGESSYAVMRLADE